MMTHPVFLYIVASSPFVSLCHLLVHNQQQLGLTVVHFISQKCQKLGFASDHSRLLEFGIEVVEGGVDAFERDPVLPMEGEAEPAKCVVVGNVQDETDHFVYGLTFTRFRLVYFFN